MFSFLKKTPPPPPSDAAGSGTAYTASQVAAIKANPVELAKEAMISNANLIVKNAGIPKEYRSEVAEYLKPYLMKIDDVRTQKLIRMAGHTCTTAWVKDAFSTLSQKIAAVRSEGLPVEDVTGPVLMQIAGLLGDGYDQVEENYFQRDAAGNIIGHYNNGRNPKCDAAIKAGETLGAARRRHRKKTVRKARKSARKTRRR